MVIVTENLVFQWRMGKGMVLTVCQYHKQRKGLSETQFVKYYYMTKIVCSGVSWYSQIQNMLNISGTTKFRKERKFTLIKNENVQ
jgi:hypothetical protein